MIVCEKPKIAMNFGNAGVWAPRPRMTSQQLNEIIEDEKKTNQGSSKVQVQVEDGEAVFDSDNTSSVLRTVLNTINNKFEHVCLDVVVRPLTAHAINKSTDDRVPGHKYSIPGLPGPKFLAQQDWAIWLIMSQWVRDADMQVPPVADKLGLEKTFTPAAAAMLCKLVTEKVVMGLLRSILWGNTLE